MATVSGFYRCIYTWHPSCVAGICVMWYLLVSAKLNIADSDRAGNNQLSICICTAYEVDRAIETNVCLSFCGARP